MRLVDEEIKEIFLHRWIMGGYRYLGGVVVKDNCLLESTLYRPLAEGGLMSFTRKRIINRAELIEES